MNTENLTFLIVSTSPERSFRLRISTERAFWGASIIEAVSPQHAIDIICPGPTVKKSASDPEWADRSKCAVIIDMESIPEHRELARRLKRAVRGCNIVKVSNLLEFDGNCMTMTGTYTQKERVRSKFKPLLQPAA